jgi:hypothetical protein
MVAGGLLQERQGVFLCRKCLADDCKLFEEMLNSVRLVCSDHSFFDFWSRELWHRHLAVKLEDGCGCSCRWRKIGISTAIHRTIHHEEDFLSSSVFDSYLRILS